MSTRTDHHDLARRASAGDIVAFRELYGDFVALVERQVCRMLGPEADVESVVQDVFVEIYRSLRRFRYDCALSTWIYSVTRNVTLGVIRERREARFAMHEPKVQAPVPRLEARDLLRRLYAALDDLPNHQRDAVYLHDIEGRTFAEIAELSGTPINTIASRVRRGRQALAAQFRGSHQRAAARVEEVEA